MLELQEQDLPPWEQKAANRRYIQYTDAATHAMILRAHHLARTPSLALDIGCEGGRWSKLLADLGWSFICTDINEQSLVLCRSRLPGAHCLLVHPADDTLPAQDESLGLVLCLEVPRVLHAPWFLSEVGRVLQQGGLLVGTYWNRRSYRGLATSVRAHFLGGPPWYSPLPYATWRSHLVSHGFSMRAAEGLCWPPFPRESNTRLIWPFVQLERLLLLHRLVSLSPYVIFIAQKQMQ